MSASADLANCPKCRAGMVHVAVTPHPIVPGMQRNNFVCYGCNQTRTYMLPTAPAEAAAKCPS
jgi:transposase-like protein